MESSARQKTPALSDDALAAEADDETSTTLAVELALSLEAEAALEPAAEALACDAVVAGFSASSLTPDVISLTVQVGVFSTYVNEMLSPAW